MRNYIETLSQTNRDFRFLHFNHIFSTFRMGFSCVLFNFVVFWSFANWRRREDGFFYVISYRIMSVDWHEWNKLLENTMRIYIEKWKERKLKLTLTWGRYRHRIAFHAQMHMEPEKILWYGKIRKSIWSTLLSRKAVCSWFKFMHAFIIGCFGYTIPVASWRIWNSLTTLQSNFNIRFNHIFCNKGLKIFKKRHYLLSR